MLRYSLAAPCPLIRFPLLEWGLEEWSDLSSCKSRSCLHRGQQVTLSIQGGVYLSHRLRQANLQRVHSCGVHLLNDGTGNGLLQRYLAFLYILFSLAPGCITNSVIVLPKCQFAGTSWMISYFFYIVGSYKTLFSFPPGALTQVDLYCTSVPEYQSGLTDCRTACIPRI